MYYIIKYKFKGVEMELDAQTKASKEAIIKVLKEKELEIVEVKQKQ